MRRFPTIAQNELGFEGTPVVYLCIGIIALFGAVCGARIYSADNKIEKSKRHHPKGIGFTNINSQKEYLRNITKKFAPNLDEKYYEYSRHNPLRHR